MNENERGEGRGALKRYSEVRRLFLTGENTLLSYKDVFVCRKIYPGTNWEAQGQAVL